jgi:CBS domain-containing protein
LERPLSIGAFPSGCPFEALMQARDIMTSPAVAVAENDTLHAAARILLDNGISAAPVLNRSHLLVGIVSEADLIARLALPEVEALSSRGVWLRSSLEAAAAFVRTHARLIRDVMTTAVITAPEEASVEELATLILGRGIKRLPIVRDGRVAGIVSRVDLLRILYSTPPRDGSAAAGPVGPSNRQQDLDLQSLVSRTMDNLPWYRAWPVEASVLHGAVHIWGRVPDEVVRQAYVMAVADVAGDREVVDHMHVIAALRHQAGGPASSPR